MLSRLNGWMNARYIDNIRAVITINNRYDTMCKYIYIIILHTVLYVNICVYCLY